MLQLAVANAFEEKILDNVKAMCGLYFSELIAGSKALVFRSTDLFQELKAPKTDSTVGQHIVDVRGQDMMVAVEFAAALCSMFDFAWPALGLHLKMDIFAPDSELVNLSSFRRRYKILIRLS